METPEKRLGRTGGIGVSIDAGRGGELRIVFAFGKSNDDNVGRESQAHPTCMEVLRQAEVTP